MVPKKHTNAFVNINITKLHESVQVLWDLGIENENDGNSHFINGHLATIIRDDPALKRQELHLMSVYLIGRGLCSQNEMHVKAAREAYDHVKPGIAAIIAEDACRSIPLWTGYNIHFQHVDECMNTITNYGRHNVIAIIMKMLHVLEAPPTIVNFVHNLVYGARMPVINDYSYLYNTEAWSDDTANMHDRILSWRVCKNRKNNPKYIKKFKRIVEKAIGINDFFGQYNRRTIIDISYIAYIQDDIVGSGVDTIVTPYCDLSSVGKSIFDTINTELFAYIQENMICNLAAAMHHSASSHMEGVKHE